MLKDLYAFKQDLSRQGIFFCFSGPISQNLVTEIGTILEQKMNLEKATKSTVVRVFSMVVEKAQNIIHYSAEKFVENHSDELSLGIIAVGYKGEHYYVLSGNMINTKDVPKLREKLTELQKMDKDELKEYYKKQRKKGPEKGSKGAGLGFIDMAKKASSPIEFEFKKVDENITFFSMKTVI